MLRPRHRRVLIRGSTLALEAPVDGARTIGPFVSTSTDRPVLCTVSARTRGRSCRSGLAEVDLVSDDLEVLGVVGQQRDAVDVGGGGDREVQCSASWRSASLCDEGV
jgi:hypothetical protein